MSMTFPINLQVSPKESIRIEEILINNKILLNEMKLPKNAPISLKIKFYVTDADFPTKYVGYPLHMPQGTAPPDTEKKYTYTVKIGNASQNIEAVKKVVCAISGECNTNCRYGRGKGPEYRFKGDITFERGFGKGIYSLSILNHSLTHLKFE